MSRSKEEAQDKEDSKEEAQNEEEPKEEDKGRDQNRWLFGVNGQRQLGGQNSYYDAVCPRSWLRIWI